MLGYCRCANIRVVSIRIGSGSVILKCRTGTVSRISTASSTAHVVQSRYYHGINGIALFKCRDDYEMGM
jgi:hypothetical protein